MMVIGCRKKTPIGRHAIDNFVSMLKEKNQLDGVALEIYIKIYDKIMCNIFCNQNVRVEQ